MLKLQSEKNIYIYTLWFIGQDGGRRYKRIRAEVTAVCVVYNSKLVPHIQGHMIESDIVWRWLFSKQPGSKRERDSSTFAAALWQREIQFSGTSTHCHTTFSCTCRLFHSAHIFSRSIRKRNNRRRRLHRDNTFVALFLNVPSSLRLLFIIALTDTVWNRDVWILSL